MKCYDATATGMFELEMLGEGKVVESSKEGEKVLYSDSFAMTHYVLNWNGHFSNGPANYWEPWSETQDNATCTHRVMSKENKE